MNCSSIPGSSGGATVLSDSCFDSAPINLRVHQADQIGARGDVQRFDIAGHDKCDVPFDPVAVVTSLRPDLRSGHE